MAKTVHTVSERAYLIKSRLLLRVHSGRAPIAPNRVDLVDEHDARSSGGCLLEELAHPGRTTPHEHLHEVAGRAGVEGHPRLGCGHAGQQGLAGAGRPHQ